MTDPEWELFDLDRDPAEMRSVAEEPAYEGDLRRMRALLDSLAREVGDDVPAGSTT